MAAFTTIQTCKSLVPKEVSISDLDAKIYETMFQIERLVATWMLSKEITHKPRSHVHMLM